MTPSPSLTISIKKLDFANTDAIKRCASIMSRSDPWITLGRDYEASIQTLSDKAKEVYIANFANEIAGFIILNMQGAFVGYIQSVCISPELRGKEIGSLLLSFAEERIFSEVPNVFICASSFNSGAQKLYQKLGYKVVGKLEDYVISGHSEILLRKTISPLSEYKIYKNDLLSSF